MTDPEIRLITVQRVRFTSDRAFDDVLAALAPGIGRPDFARLRGRLAQAPSYDDFARLVDGATGSSGLLEITRMDLDLVARFSPSAPGGRLVRITAGNPVTMSRMTARVPDAGSYAPVTILVYERGGQVHLVYDTVASALAPYADEAALAVAGHLDEQVIGVLRAAAG